MLPYVTALFIKIYIFYILKKNPVTCGNMRMVAHRYHIKFCFQFKYGIEN